MNKKILIASIAISLAMSSFASAKADISSQPTLAIIDTALNSDMSEIKNNIVYEVCLLDWKTCPNNTQFQEGPGAAALPLNKITKNGFEHGTNMVSAAINTNPNVKIVFIRFVGATPITGDRQITNENSIVNAMTWVLYNKDRFNIRAVALSQSHHNLGIGINYCPNTPLTSNIINQLVSANIPVFLPAGNLKDLKRVSWPACIPSAVTISASAYGDSPAIYTNYDANITDIFARGDMSLLSPNGTKSVITGTSISAQVAASSYLALVSKYPTYTSDQLISLLKTKTIPIVSRTIKANIINVSAVLNG